MREASSHTWKWGVNNVIFFFAFRLIINKMLSTSIVAIFLGKAASIRLKSLFYPQIVGLISSINLPFNSYLQMLLHGCYLANGHYARRICRMPIALGRRDGTRNLLPYPTPFTLISLRELASSAMGNFESKGSLAYSLCRSSVQFSSTLATRDPEN